MPNKISAVIVTYHPELKKLKEQVDRLVKQVQYVVIVDNNSANANEIKQVFSEASYAGVVNLYYNGENKGLGYAQNKGISIAVNLGVLYVLLLDDDSLIEENFVGNLISEYNHLTNNGKKVGAIGPVYYNEETGEKYPITKYIGPLIDRRHPENEAVEATFLIASGCLIPVEVLNNVGLMNEDFFIDYIDVEWSFRAISKGYRLYATPKAQMNHIIGERRANVFGRKISIHSPLRKYYLFRNSIFMIKCPYISFGYKVREIIFNFLRFITYMILTDDKKRYIRYAFLGYKDGFVGKKGRCTYNF